jgi:hypothetical protein
MEPCARLGRINKPSGTWALMLLPDSADVVLAALAALVAV